MENLVDRPDPYKSYCSRHPLIVSAFTEEVISRNTTAIYIYSVMVCSETNSTLFGRGWGGYIWYLAFGWRTGGDSQAEILEEVVSKMKIT